MQTVTNDMFEINNAANQEMINAESFYNIGIISASGLGDALLFAVLANQLQHAGHRVTLYSNLLAQLAPWFPTFTVRPFPEKTTAAIENTLAQHDKAIIDGYSIVTKTYPTETYATLAQRYIFVCMSSFDERLKTAAATTADIEALRGMVIPSYNKKSAMADNIAAICRERLQLPEADKSNGIGLPKGKNITAHALSKRIIIHPTSTKDSKNWPLEKFILLARKLKSQGWEPVFTMSPDEHQLLAKHIEPEFLAPLFPSLNELAEMIYQSAYFIGNDSGIGHLASCLGLPTLNVFAQTKTARKWRPSWSYGIVVTGPQYPRILRRFWKSLLSVNKVYKAFLQLTRLSLLPARGEG